MFVMGNFVQAIATVLSYALDIFGWLILIRALLSWVNPDPNNGIVQFIERATEPILAPLRKLVPPYRIGLDVSPILALLLIYFLKIFLVQTLIGIAARLQ